MGDSEGFDRLYRATNASAVYREAIRASANGLPDWLVPFSVIDGAHLERFATELQVGEGATFVDLGCGSGGPGLWVAERTGAHLIGVDFSASAIGAAATLAERRSMSGRARFVAADATATGLPDACAAGVMSVDALMFIDPERVATEIRRLLKPRGRFVMTVAESLVEPFTPALVTDYRPVFERAGLRTVLRDDLAGHDEQQLALYRALDERAERLLAEMGEAAESLLEEARGGLERKPRRVRHVFMVAERVD